MSLVNWGAVTPTNDQGPGREVASISGLLSALADRRMRAQIEEQRQADADREFAAHQANTLEDNRRQNEDLRLRTQYNNDTLDNQKVNQSLMRTQGADSRALQAMEAARRRGDVGDTAGESMFSRMAQEAYGANGVGQPGTAQPPMPADQAPSPPAPAAVQPPAFIPQSPGVFPGAAPQDPSATPPGGAPGMPGPSPAGPASAPLAGPPPAGPQGPSAPNSPPTAAPMGAGAHPGAAPAPQVRAPAGRVLDYAPVDRQGMASAATAQLAPMKALSTQSPLHKQAYDTVMAEVASGLPPAKAFPAFNTVLKGLQDREAAMARTQVTTAASALKGPTPNKRALDENNIYRVSVQSALALKKYGEVVHNDRKLAELAAAASGGNDNPALAAIVKGAFVKYAQGGTGVVSDQDMRVFWDSIGGLPERTWQVVQQAYDGNLGKDKQRIVQEAIKHMLGVSQANKDDMGKTVAAALERMPQGAKEVPGFLKEFAPEYLPKWAKSRAKAGAQAQASGADDAFLREAEGGK